MKYLHTLMQMSHLMSTNYRQFSSYRTAGVSAEKFRRNVLTNYWNLMTLKDF